MCFFERNITSTVKSILHKIYCDLSQTISGGTNELRFIDLLRGVASVIILIVHYKHFFMGAGSSVVVSEIVEVEYFNLWAPVAYWGANVVQLFWAISGFIFIHVYAGRLNVSVKSFLLSRFARLYPLHLITLVSVAIMQYVNLSNFNAFSIYSINDAYHFILNLFFASSWGFESGLSFNGPIWSVSVEVFSYGMFFLFLKHFRINILSLLVITILCFVLYFLWKSLIVLCLIYFFAGCLAYGVMEFLANKFGQHAIVIMLCIFTLFTLLAFLNEDLPYLILYVPAFCSLLILLNLIEYKYGSAAIKKLDWLGRTSYGNYLIHSPLQMLFLIFVSFGFLELEHVMKWYFMGVYITVVIMFSLLSFKYIEKPIQKMILNRF